MENFDSKQFNADIDTFLSIAEDLEEPGAKVVIRELADVLKSHMSLAQTLDQLNGEADTALKQTPRDETKLGELKAKLVDTSKQAESLRSVVIPELIRRLQESTQNEEIKGHLRKMGEAFNSNPAASALTAEGEDKQDGDDDGSSLWE